MTELTERDLERAKLAQKDLPKYTKPSNIFIGLSATQLYNLERRRSAAIRACANEWARVIGVDKAEFWTRSIPQSLYETLEQYEIGAAVIAAEAFLERYGYTITRPTFPKENSDGNAD